jgi:hypothetical protein
MPHSSSAPPDMHTLYIQAMNTDAAGHEDPAVTRDRLKDCFPRGATRRMTQLGMLIGSVLSPHSPAEDDTLIYASEYAETRALEGYLDSFPSASPTLFQTSIHPSAVQQLLIQRQQPVRTFFPLTGGRQLIRQALQIAVLSETPRVLLCGGEERGTWLLEHNAASAETFAFAIALTKDRSGQPLGQLDVSFDGAMDGLSLPTFFQALHTRSSLCIGPENTPTLRLSWL